MKFYYLGESDRLILFALSTITFKLLHWGFLLGGKARGLVDSFILVFCYSNSQYF